MARPVFDAFDDSHGRLVRRRVFVCPEAASLEALDAWPGLRTVLAVETIRGVNGSGTVEAEIRYFLSSCRDDPKVLIQAIRRHWTIEKVQTWRLSRLSGGGQRGARAAAGIKAASRGRLPRWQGSRRRRAQASAGWCMEQIDGCADAPCGPSHRGQH
jgi:hypothetical protein